MSQRKEIGRRKGVTKAGHSHIFFSGIRNWESGIGNQGLRIRDWESGIRGKIAHKGLKVRVYMEFSS